MRSRDQDRGVGRPGDGGEARVGLQPFEAEGAPGDSGSKAGREVGQHDLDQPLDQGALDRGVGPALDAHRRGAAPAAQQHVDDRVDQGGIDHQQAVIVPLLRLEHRQHRRQRDRVQVVAEAQRRDVVEADLDIVGGEVAQRGGHDAHQAVEDDLQHRQAFVGDQRRVDDRPDAGAFSPPAGPSSKPSRLSISSWFSTRAGWRCRGFRRSPSASAPQAAASSSSV